MRQTDTVVATDDQVSAICEIAHELKITPQQAPQAPLDRGFLVYPLSPSEYRRRLNPFFYAALLDGRVEGFLMAYRRDRLQTLIEGGHVSHEDGVMNYLLNLRDDRDFLFLDQIAVRATARKAGLAHQLARRLKSDVQGQNIQVGLCAILHAPVVNRASVAFSRSLGLQLQHTVTNSDGLTWGIYKRDLSV